MENHANEFIKGKSLFYIVVRFELRKGELETLVPLIREFFKKEVSGYPGFVSSRIHTNAEGTLLINYATWESPEKFQRFFQEVGAFSEFGKKIQTFTPTTDRVFEIPL